MKTFDTIMEYYIPTYIGYSSTAGPKFDNPLIKWQSLFTSFVYFVYLLRENWVNCFGNRHFRMYSFEKGLMLCGPSLHTNHKQVCMRFWLIIFDSSINNYTYVYKLVLFSNLCQTAF